MTKNTDKSVKIYNATTILQQKIGTGPLDPELIKKAQKIIEENKVDFTPLGLDFLKKLKATLDNIQSSNQDANWDSYKQQITEPVMELKANAAIFHYPLIGELANIMLSFLETVKQLDPEAIEIVSAHHDTLHAIITKNMSGKNGLEQGQPFIAELKDACARYFKKQPK